MFTNVLIGMDGHEGGRDAVALARRLAAPEAKVTLAHVCNPYLGRGAAAAMALESTEAQTLLEHERELAGVNACLTVKGPRPVGSGLHELAEDQEADLLVVGATRHHLLGRVLIGDDCRGALDGASCAIAVAPSGYSRASHRSWHLGVGYDASPESELALHTARELVGIRCGEITLLWVISPENVRQEKPIPADWPQATDALMDRHTKHLAQIEGVQGLVAAGGPREALVQFARELDLLIVGSRGHGRIDRIVHGSVSGYLARHATCPLLVVPRQSVPAFAPFAAELDANALVAAGG